MQLDYNAINNASTITCNANWLTCTFKSNYSNTQKFNVISSASKKINGYGLVDSSRRTDIVYKFNPDILSIGDLPQKETEQQY